MSSFGTLTSVKKVSQNGEAPAISLIGRVSTPGWLHVDQHEADALVLLGVVSVRTRQKHQSAYCAPEVQIFWPLISQWSPLSSHLVCRRGEVGAGAGLGVALAPAHLAAARSAGCGAASAPRCRTRAGRAEHRDAHAADRVAGADRGPSPAAARAPRRSRGRRRRIAFGQVGAPQPFSPMRWRHSSASPLGSPALHQLGPVRRRRAARSGSSPRARPPPRARKRLQLQVRPASSAIASIPDRT